MIQTNILLTWFDNHLKIKFMKKKQPTTYSPPQHWIFD